MRIAIDSRFYGLEHTGLGRYTMHLIEELAQIDHQNHYYLLLRQPLFDQFFKTTTTGFQSLQYSLPSNFHPVLADARHYSFREQLLLPGILRSIKPHLLHVLHFNIPIFWRGKLIVTIHDLIKHVSTGPQTSTLPVPAYWFKHQIYYRVLQIAVHRASDIITPSRFVKHQVLRAHPSIPSAKIHITPEAPDPIYYQKSPTSLKNKLLTSYRLTPRFLIYTGNAYPHKNLENLIRALALLKNTTPVSNLSLVIVSARNVFRRRLQCFVAQQGLTSRVKFLGFVPDQDLCQLYRCSLAFITPSLHEGFGLSGLEAMAAGTPVLSSSASCLPEVYQEAATYFDPHNPQDIAQKILQIADLSPVKRKSLIACGLKHSRKFSWGKMARQTLRIYRSLEFSK